MSGIKIVNPPPFHFNMVPRITRRCGYINNITFNYCCLKFKKIKEVNFQNKRKASDSAASKDIIIRINR